ncbi:MAG: hypothetical protein ACLFUP_00235 [Desulfobacteraceae bacterium]
MSVFGLGLLALYLCIFQGEAWAAQEISDARKIWDTVMRWVNFGIMAFFFWKYGKPALVSFLQNETGRVKRTLDEINSELAESKARMEEESKKLEGIDEDLQHVRDSILEMGQREKERILKDARTAADQMVQSAQAESQTKLEMAKRTLNDELVEKALVLAEEKLKQAFTQEDHERLLSGFTSSLEKADSERPSTTIA